MTRLIRVDQRKWPDREHYQFEARRLGQDKHGTWVHAPTGTLVRRGKEDPFPFRAGFIGLVPENGWWVAEFFPDHPEIAAYVNIGTPPAWNGDHMTQIDLDLDVVRRLDGTIEIVDEDEFEENRVTFGYPEQVVERAREAADQAVDFLERNQEPFGGAFEPWLDRVDPETMRRL